MGGMEREKRLPMRVKREIDVETMMATKGSNAVVVVVLRRERISSDLSVGFHWFPYRHILHPLLLSFSCLLVTFSPVSLIPVFLLQYSVLRRSIDQRERVSQDYILIRVCTVRRQ